RGAATAEIAATRATDTLGWGEWLLVEKRLAGEDKARSAKATLGSIIFNECLLHRVQFPRLHQGLDRRDRLVLRLNSKYRTGVYGLILHQYGAGAAFGAVTDALGACEFELIPQGVEQSNPRFETYLVQQIGRAHV